MPSELPERADGGGPGAPGAPGGGPPPACLDAASIRWEDFPGPVIKFPDDLPLHGLMVAANRLLGLYGQHTVAAAGLKVSLSGLGVLRVLMASDGMKSTELAERAMTTPGTVTSVVNTLVRGGFVERKPDEADRRVVRLYITDAGRAVITYYVTQMGPRWRKAFDFVDEADEAAIRRFFLQMIDHLNQLLREESGA